MRFSRDSFVVVILLILLVGLAGLAAYLNATQPKTPTRIAYSTHTVEPQGAQALQRWLEALGYHTSRIEGAFFAIPDDARVLFILDETTFADTRDASAVVSWVARGNTAIIADTSDFGVPNALMRAFKEGRPHRFDASIDRAQITQPILGGLPSESALVKTSLALTLDRADYVEYLNAQGAPLLVSFKQGQGTVWLTSAPFLFTNDGLRDETNSALVSSLIPSAARGGLVAFDEYHLGFRGQANDQVNFSSLLFSTPWGWAIIYIFVIGLVFLVVNGQRFGRVVPLPTLLARRHPSEYVTSMAQLYRRAGKRQIVSRHYYQHVKRHLAQPYRINPDLPDEEFIAALARHNDRIDREALAVTLRSLHETKLSERGLVKLVDQAIKLTRRGQA